MMPLVYFRFVHPPLGVRTLRLSIWNTPADWMEQWRPSRLRLVLLQSCYAGCTAGSQAAAGLRVTCSRVCPLSWTEAIWGSAWQGTRFVRPVCLWGMSSLGDLFLISWQSRELMVIPAAGNRMTNGTLRSGIWGSHVSPLPYSHKLK